MIDKISNYAETLILLIIAITIIELLLPKSNNKKYVMLVCSLVVMLAVINPIINLLNEDFDISQSVSEMQREINEIEYSSSANYDLEYNVYNTYVANLKSNMQERLEDMGYEVLETKININKSTYEPTNIEMKVKYEDGYIQPIVIDVFENSSKDKIYEADKNKIKDILSVNYGIDKESIKINE